jgi:hypothetical protein
MDHALNTHNQAEEHHDHNHKQIISKYIFSLDHKMIAKQYLISYCNGNCWSWNVFIIPYNYSMEESLKYLVFS